MFGKIVFTALISTVALSAFSSETRVAGRSRNEGPGNSDVSTIQSGRYRMTGENSGSFTSQNQSSNGDTLVAGRYQQSGQSDYATTRVYDNGREFNQMRTQRAPAADVTNRQYEPAPRIDRK